MTTITVHIEITEQGLTMEATDHRTNTSSKMTLTETDCGALRCDPPVAYVWDEAGFCSPLSDALSEVARGAREAYWSQGES